MNRERLEQLLWERIDGTISPDDLRQLTTQLEEQPQSRKLEREVAAVAEILSDPQPVEPPGELRSRIRQALASSPGPKTTSGHPPPAARTGSGRPVPGWAAMAASLLIGVAVGYLLHLAGSAPVDPARASGAMSTAIATTPATMLPIDLGPDVGSMELRLRAGELLIDLELATAVQLEAVVEADGPTETALEARGPGRRQLAVDGEGFRRLIVRVDGAEVAALRLDGIGQGRSP